MSNFSFGPWVRQRHGLEDPALESDKVVPLLTQAGRRGMTRSEVGKVIDLEREDLDALLASLVHVGLLYVAWEGGLQVFRDRAVATRGRRT